MIRWDSFLNTTTGYLEQSMIAEKDNLLYLFDSGAIDELIKANLIPHTKISDIQLEGFNLVVEHEKIEVVIYPTEWSFNMLKRCCIISASGK